MVVEKDYATVPCRHCGKATMMLGTRECDRCHELSVRIERDPEIALAILTKQPLRITDPKPTLRDQFAMHAPVKAPSWFRHKAPFEVPPIVDFREALRRVEEAEGLDLLEVRNSIINWSIEPTFAMDDPDLNRIGEAAFDIVDESKRKRAAAMEANEAATWFAWRWHYATTMMRMREGA